MFALLTGGKIFLRENGNISAFHVSHTIYRREKRMLSLSLSLLYVIGRGDARDDKEWNNCIY